jgi:hypothetical protein
VRWLNFYSLLTNRQAEDQIPKKDSFSGDGKTPVGHTYWSFRFGFWLHPFDPGMGLGEQPSLPEPGGTVSRKIKRRA